MRLTKAMKERADRLGATWKDEGRGYASLAGQATVPVAYVALPSGHPLRGVGYNDVPGDGPEVNGGLTFAEGNVFGWDYGHCRDTGPGDVAGHTKAALAYFRRHEKRRKP